MKEGSRPRRSKSVRQNPTKAPQVQPKPSWPHLPPQPSLTSCSLWVFPKDKWTTYPFAFTHVISVFLFCIPKRNLQNSTNLTLFAVSSRPQCACVSVIAHFCDSQISNFIRNIHLNTFLIRRTEIYFFFPTVGYLGSSRFFQQTLFSRTWKRPSAPPRPKQIRSPSEVWVQTPAGIAALARKPQQENICPMHTPCKYREGEVTVVEGKPFSWGYVSEEYLRNLELSLDACGSSDRMEGK